MKKIITITLLTISATSFAEEQNIISFNKNAGVAEIFFKGMEYENRRVKSEAKLCYQQEQEKFIKCINAIMTPVQVQKGK